MRYFLTRGAVVAACLLAANGCTTTATSRGEAQAGDTCARGEPAPVLRAGGDGLVSHELMPHRDDGTADETATLKDGTVVAIKHAGCAHYVLTFSFPRQGTSPDERTPALWLARAAEVFGKLVDVANHPGAIRNIAQALVARAADTYTYGEIITISELETVSLRVEEGSAGAELRVIYDVAL